MPGLPFMQGLCTHADDHLSLRVPLSMGEAHLLPHQRGECRTLMVTPQQARAQVISTVTGATEGVGRSGWLLQDWICRSSSQLIQVCSDIHTLAF